MLSEVTPPTVYLRLAGLATVMDSITMIEDGIKETLDAHPIAQVSVAVIQEYYILLDDNFSPVDGSLEDRCRTIAKNLDADFEVRGEKIWLRRKRKETSRVLVGQFSR